MKTNNGGSIIKNLPFFISTREFFSGLILCSRLSKIKIVLFGGNILLLIYCATPAKLADKKKEIMDFVTEQGYGPFHPFQAFEYDRFEGGPVGREKTMEFCCKAIDICDEFWLFGISEGTLTELCHAIEKSKPIKLFLDKFDPDWQKEYKKLKNKFSDPLSKIKSDT